MSKDRQECPFDDGTLLHKLELSEVVRLVKGHYAYYGLLMDWQLAPLLLECGYTLRGLSLTQKPDEWLQVLKITADDLPYVVFTSAYSPRDCMTRMLGGLARADLRVYPDKYG